MGQRNYCLSLLSCFISGTDTRCVAEIPLAATTIRPRPWIESPSLRDPGIAQILQFPRTTASPFRGNSHHIRKVTRSQAAADRQLNPLQQPSGTPLLFQPVHRNQRPTVFGASAATSLANREMSDNEPLRCQRMCRIRRNPPSPVLSLAIGKIVRAPSHGTRRSEEAAGRSSG